MAAPLRSPQIVLTTLGGLAFSALLITGVVHFVGIDFGRIFAILQAVAWPIVGIVLVSLIVQFLLSARKWMVVQERLVELDHVETSQDAKGGLMVQFVYVAISAVFAQLLTTYLASVVVRGLAERWHFKRRFRTGAAVSVFEQIFDVFVVVGAGLPVLLLLAAGATPQTALAFAAAAIIGLVLMASVGIDARPVIVQLTSRLQHLAPRLRAIAGSPAIDRLASPILVRHLLVLSIARYLAMALRTVAVAVLLLPGLEPIAAAAGFSAIQLSAILPLTPGNLGITEWGWAGFGLFLGQNAAIFAAFALTLRLVTFGLTVAIAGLALVAGLLAGGLRRYSNESRKSAS